MINLKGIGAKSEKKEVLLKDIDVEFSDNSINLVLGPNGAGKTTLARVIMGDADVFCTGKIFLNEDNITSKSMDERARLGIFLAHQTPVEIPGVKALDFLHSAYESVNGESIDIWEFYDWTSSEIQRLGLDKSLLRKDLNEGLSGGEKKKFELFQMLILKPKVAILDEIDSGLDIDSIKEIFQIISAYQKDTSSTIIVISHNSNILKYTSPDKVVLLDDKTIQKKGDKKLAEKILEEGYGG